MMGQSLHPPAIPSDLPPPAHAMTVRPSTLRTIAWSVLVVTGTGATALVAALAVVAVRFAHLGASAPVSSPLRIHADVRMALGYRAHHVELEATAVDLNHLGQHTHANWVVFALPFDTAAPGIRNVRFEPHALRETNVAALPTAIGCVPTPTLGPVEGRAWGEFTANGANGTRFFADHPFAPTSDSHTFAVNVPTRVANAAACWDPSLRERATWRLDVSWESPDES